MKEVTEGRSAGKPTPFVTVWEYPATSYNWEILSEEQAELAEEFGDARTHPKPDYTPELNRWA